MFCEIQFAVCVQIKLRKIMWVTMKKAKWWEFVKIIKDTLQSQNVSFLPD